jgi:prepilin-type N-terminal cleavage/methylation domain-containing protein
MRNNRGFSLLELIVAVALIAISLTVLSLSISEIFASNAKECANQLDALLSQCKVDAMSQSGNVYLEVYQDTDGVHAKIINDKNPTVPLVDQKIGKNSLSVQYQDSAGTTPHSIPSSDPLYLSFDRTTGAFLDLYRCQRLVGTPSVSSGVFCAKLTVSSGRKTINITLYPSTGGHILE